MGKEYASTSHGGAAELTTLAEPLLYLEPTSNEDVADTTIVVEDDNIEQPQDEQNQTWSRGEKQPVLCHDGIWALLFIAQFAVIATLGIAWGLGGSWPTGYDSPDTDYNNNQDTHIYFSDFAILLLWTSLGATAISSLALFVMTRWAKVLIQLSFLFNIVMSLAIAILCFAENQIATGVMALIFSLLGICYAWSVWRIVPWAASNLTTAVTAIATNFGVVFIGLAIMMLTIGFTVLWLLAIIGVTMHTTVCTNTTTTDGSAGSCESHLNEIIFALFLLSLYWTFQVFKNLLHVTVAGVIGTWWFAPHEARSCCSSSVKDSLVRASTTSFGSICLGSLLVAALQTLYQIVYYARRRIRGHSVLLCLLECIADFLQNLMEYFNKWGFVYVGLYGYTYWEAGPKVMTLFSERGWSAILNDQLVYRVLNWMSLIIGTLSGLVGAAVVQVCPQMLRGVDADAEIWVAFFIGLVIGGALSNILLSIIASAVDTVLVCFAEAPLEFRLAYPELSERMEEAWLATFPGEFRVVADHTMV